LAESPHIIVTHDTDFFETSYMSERAQKNIKGSGFYSVP
jgi:hypothetical protein